MYSSGNNSSDVNIVEITVWMEQGRKDGKQKEKGGQNKRKDGQEKKRTPKTRRTTTNKETFNKNKKKRHVFQFSQHP